MSKTPEQLAEDYADDWHKDCDYPAEILRHTKKATETVFLAGYQAAKDQLADADKVVCNTTMKEIKDVDTGELMPITYSPPQSQWISVNERLPEEGQMCVVQSNWHGVLLSERIEDRWLLKEDDGHYERPTHWVTHWMPLPKPPEVE